MSFSRIPVSYAFGREIYDTVPRSTQIKEDALLSFAALDEIKSGNLYNSTERLQNIINVYNENVQYINKTIEKQEHFTERTYGQYCQEFSSMSKPKHADYVHEETIRQHKLFVRMDEDAQISQLGYVFTKLAKKITHTAERLKGLESITGELPAFTLIAPKNRYEHDFFAPRLRRIEVPVETPKTVADLTTPAPQVKIFFAPALRRIEVPVETPKTVVAPTTPAPQMKIEEVKSNPIVPTPDLSHIAEEIKTKLTSLPDQSASQPASLTSVMEQISISASTALKIDVTVFCNLSSEKTLGICCHPTWGEQPTLFTKGENNSWTGQVPIDQDWKFITLENGQVKGWEQGKNRRCNSQTQAFTIKPNEVKFS